MLSCFPVGEGRRVVPGSAPDVAGLRLSPVISRLVLTCVLYMLFRPGAGLCAGGDGTRGGVAAAPAVTTTVEWVLPSDVLCLIRSDCAVFTPSDGDPVQQGSFLPTTLHGPGELCLQRPASFTLRSRQNGEVRNLLLQGPSCYFLEAHGLVLYSPGRGEYNRVGPGESSGPSSIRFAVPPLVAGTHGTRFRYILTVDGLVGLLVLEGAVEVAWIDESRPAARLEAGDALFAGDRELATRTLQVFTGEEARRMFANLEISPLPVRKGVGDAAYDFEGFSAALMTPGVEASSQLARAFVEGRRGGAVTPRVLYFAWLKAQTLGQQEDALELSGLAHREFPSSAWTALIPSPGGGGPP